MNNIPKISNEELENIIEDSDLSDTEAQMAQLILGFREVVKNNRYKVIFWKQGDNHGCYDVCIECGGRKEFGCKSGCKLSKLLDEDKEEFPNFTDLELKEALNHSIDLSSVNVPVYVARYAQWIILARKALKKIEWCVPESMNKFSHWGKCPDCGEPEHKCMHKDDCTIAIMLNKHKSVK